MRVMLGSAGRRVYLVDWFRHAIAATGRPGQVHITENNPYAPTAAVADEVHVLPTYDDPDYGDALTEAVHRVRADLFLTLNDYDLDALAGGIADRIRSAGTTVLSLPREVQHAASDKAAMVEYLGSSGIATPHTVLASDTAGVLALVEAHEMVVMKNRHGGGSAGLRHVRSDEVSAAVAALRDPSATVVQPRVDGIEYGIDVVAPPRGGGVQAVLARRKLSMRGGETATAVTVDSGPFLEIADRLNAAYGFQGIADVDVIVDHAGMPHVLDVNPRFGGGYPFVHMAGADVPAYLVSAVAGVSAPAQWNAYRAGVLSAKHEAMATFHATFDA